MNKNILCFLFYGDAQAPSFFALFSVQRSILRVVLAFGNVLLKRKIVLRIPVTQEERALIEQKMVLLHTKNFSAYARKMLIDGYIVNMDTTDIRAQTAEIQKIGVNVNQIAKRLNSMGPVYAQDIEDIKGALTQIWQLQRYILSSQR